MLLYVKLSAQNDSIANTKEIKKLPEVFTSIIHSIKTQAETTKDADIEFDGLLIDNTKTKNGRDFYEYFYREWSAPVNARNFTVFIAESPYRLTTTMIEIKINETLVFQSYLQARSDFLETLAIEAVQQTQIYLKDYDEIVKQLEGDDRSGSGIY
jgi:curli production assembly/transport component CsgE